MAFIDPAFEWYCISKDISKPFVPMTPLYVSAYIYF